MTVWTVGHSTRSLEELVELLREHAIVSLCDVRTAPGSRRLPHFNRDNLRTTLPDLGIAYMHMPELGGLRRARPDSVNTGWRNASFRGYADYMQQPEFSAGLERLIHLASEKSTAVMCAEAVPWRCHRSLIGDALQAYGAEVVDILSPHSAQVHRRTPFAVIEGRRVTYPPAVSGS